MWSVIRAVYLYSLIDKRFSVSQQLKRGVNVACTNPVLYTAQLYNTMRYRNTRTASLPCKVTVFPLTRSITSFPLATPFSKLCPAQVAVPEFVESRPGAVILLKVAPLASTALTSLECLPPKTLLRSTVTAAVSHSAAELVTFRTARLNRARRAGPEVCTAGSQMAYAATWGCEAGEGRSVIRDFPEEPTASVTSSRPTKDGEARAEP